MRLTEEQKNEVAIEYVKNCDDINLVLNILNISLDRLNELLQEQNDYIDSLKFKHGATS